MDGTQVLNLCTIAIASNASRSKPISASFSRIHIRPPVSRERTANQQRTVDWCEETTISDTHTTTEESGSVVLGTGSAYCPWVHFSTSGYSFTYSGHSIGHYRTTSGYTTSSSCSSYSRYSSVSYSSPCMWVYECPRGWGTSGDPAYRHQQLGLHRIPDLLSLRAVPRYCLAGTYYPDRECH